MKQKESLTIKILKVLLRIITCFTWREKKCTIPRETVLPKTTVPFKEVPRETVLPKIVIPIRKKYIKTEKIPTVVKLKTKKRKTVKIKGTKGKKKNRKK